MSNQDIEFAPFLECFNLDMKSSKQKIFNFKLPSILLDIEEANHFMSSYEGMTFGNLIYRIHLAQDIQKWSLIVKRIFPETIGNITCFGYDWLGRQFCIISYGEISEIQIFRFDVSTNEAIILSSSFLEFHNTELTKNNEHVLSQNLFKQWINNNKKEIYSNQCAGFIHPPILGGKLGIDNLKNIDLEVYWSILGQILLKMRSFPENSKIPRIKNI